MYNIYWQKYFFLRAQRYKMAEHDATKFSPIWQLILAGNEKETTCQCKSIRDMGSIPVLGESHRQRSLAGYSP